MYHCFNIICDNTYVCSQIINFGIHKNPFNVKSDLENIWQKSCYGQGFLQLFLRRKKMAAYFLGFKCHKDKIIQNSEGLVHVNWLLSLRDYLRAKHFKQDNLVKQLSTILFTVEISACFAYWVLNFTML